MKAKIPTEMRWIEETCRKYGRFQIVTSLRTKNNAAHQRKRGNLSRISLMTRRLLVQTCQCQCQNDAKTYQKIRKKSQICKNHKK